METEGQKGLERVISQRALQMSSSFPCKSAVAGFLCGVCVTYLFVAAVTSSRVVEFGIINENSYGLIRNKDLSSLDAVHEDEFGENEIGDNLQRGNEFGENERLSLLYSAWSSMLDGLEDDENNFSTKVGLKKSNVPEAPHIENCKSGTELNQVLDSYGENGSFPPWTIHKGLLGVKLLDSTLTSKVEHKHFGQSAQFEGPYPPWILGSDEDNFPLTRKVQHDVWMHQHPWNCSDPQVRFLVADWERLPGFGLGAQIAGMCGLLAIAINEQRVLVTNYFNRADHEGCQGPSHSRWSCYFLPETSKECQDRAFELARSEEAWIKGIITGNDNYTSKEIWAGRIPRVWGNPWDYMQSTTEINGSLIKRHRKMDWRWWRAQAVRYLMRFQSEYTCKLLNIARHKAYGMQAATLVLQNLGTEWPKMEVPKPRAEMEQFVWSNYKPWIPRPFLSLHVRMGDKACEMKVVGFETYMQLADRVRQRFPSLNSIWLSTEMQEVIDKSRHYPRWTFYYTNVTRQVGNITMAAYEASLGRETSTNYPLVNFLMASEADFFIGALGSTWCFLIDGMRSTGGKVTAGYLSVNKDRFW